MNSFFRDVISHLIKNAFEGHTQFSVADNTAVGANPVRSITLDAVPSNENTIISLSWEGGEKLFEKTLSEQEASHQFDLISTDLAEVAALTKQGNYEGAKDLMKKLGQKYAENTGDIVDTNLPKLHNTQASEKVAIASTNLQEGDKVYVDTDTAEWGRVVGPATILENPVLNRHNILVNVESVRADILVPFKDIFKQAAQKCERCEDIKSEADPSHEYDPDCAGSLCSKHEKEYLDNKKASQDDDKIWRKAKITMQNLWFSNTSELLEYQEKQKGAKSNQDHIPLWDAQKGKGAEPKDELAPASMSYEDLENSKERDHEDMQKHIDEKIKTELESALQEKAASVFGPADIELVKSLRAPGIGRNWDEIKKIFIKDLNRDKDATTIFLDEQRQSLDPAGIEVEPVKEEEKPLTPPEDLVSPETHEKLLQDHEDKKKIDSPVKEDKELNFTPKDVMDIPEDKEIEEVSSLNNEIARADNADIHKIAAPSDLNPLQEPLTEQPTTPSQDVVPMGKKPTDHNAPQHGDRVFVTTDLSNEKSGFEANFINTFKGDRGEDKALVVTDQGDNLEVELNRVVKINEGASGAQDTEPVMEPIIEQQQPENDVQITPKMDDFHTSSQEDLLVIKAEVEGLLKIAEIWNLETQEEEWAAMELGQIADRAVAGDLNEQNYLQGIWDGESWDSIKKKLETEGSVWYVWWMDGVHNYIRHNAENTEASKKANKISFKFIKKGLEKHADDSAFEGNGWCRVWIQEDEIASDSRYPEILKLPDENSRIEALKDLARELAHEALRLADSAGAKVGVQSWFDSLKPSDHDRIDWVKLANPQVAESSLETKQASDFEKGISQNKTSVDESTCALCGNKIINGNGVNRKGRPYCKSCAEGLDIYGSNKIADDLPEGQNRIRIVDPHTRKCIDCGRKLDPSNPSPKCLKCNPGVQEKTADPVEAPKTQFKDYKITPKYTPKEQAVPATPEMDEVLTKMDSLQSNLATLEAARKQIQAKMKEELTKIDDQGERAQMEAALQESIEKAAVLISAMDNKVIQWKDRLYTLQTEEISYVPSLTPKEMLSKIYAKFSGAEKYVQDVLNGMLSQGKNVLEKTLIRWPNKKSGLSAEADSSPLDMMNHYNEELLAALKELSSPL